jgi:hypothetical protein
MAIQFARARYISRASGGSAVRSAAYNERAAIVSDRTGELFYFKRRDAPEHHEVGRPPCFPHLTWRYQNDREYLTRRHEASDGADRTPKSSRRAGGAGAVAALMIDPPHREAGQHRVWWLLHDRAQLPNESYSL